MRLPEEPDQPFQINILPMIDVVFALLTFFIMSTLSLTQSQGLPLVTVTIDPKGNLSLNQKPIDLPALQGGIKAKLEKTTQKTVLIRADEAVSHGKVVAVMDAIRKVPGAKLAIEADAVKK
jgi:biopolymer transport protein ExbD